MTRRTFGAGNDLEIYHNGSARIANSTGNLIISDTDGDIYIQAKAGENSIRANNDGSVLVYFDNAEKLATTSTGIDVTGTATMDGLTVDGGITTTTANVALDVVEGTSGSDAIIGIVADGSGRTQIRSTNGLGNSSDLRILTRDSGGTTSEVAKFYSNGDISFYEDTGTTPKFFWDASAESLGIGTAPDAATVLHVQATEPQVLITDASIPLQRFMAFDVGLAADEDTHFITVDQADALAFGEKLNGNDRVIENEWMRITNAGNVGIGTASPAAIIHSYQGASGQASINAFANGLVIEDNASNGISILTPSTAIGSIFFGDEADNFIGGLRYDHSDNSLATYVNNAERMRIDSSGELTTTNGKVNLITVGRGAGAVSTNTAVGASALAANTSGAENTASGYEALYSNTTGSSNTATGRDALYSNTTASHNTAVGRSALTSNTTGAENTAVGRSALSSNTTGGDNTAVGRSALINNTTASYNTALGRQALLSNTTGADNTATGYRALYSNTTGTKNIASGVDALYTNTTGSNNVATGYKALVSNTEGNSNTAYGDEALRSNTTGDNNTATGRNALYSNTTGSGNIGLGFRNNAGTYAPVFDPTTENNRVVMGHTAVTNAYVQVAWTVVSDARDKMNFAPVPHGLDFVKQLNPVAYQFKIDRDTETPNGNVRYGFKAQDILALEGDNPVIIDNEDEDKLKYNGESLVPVLVKAMQEQQAIIESLTNRIAALEGN